MAGGKIVFKGDTSGLKAVSREIINMADKVKGLNQSLTQADTALMENAKQIGYMSSSAKSTTKQLSEMVAVVKDLTVHYNSLTAAEKSSPYGKVLQGSISQLTERVKTLKSGIDEANKGMKETEGKSVNLKSIFGGVAGSVLKLGTVAGATTAAFSAFKDIFTSTASGALQWQTTIQSVKATYESFLVSVNTGSVNGFLQNIQAIISATEDAQKSIAALGKSLTYDSVPLERAKNEWQDAMDVYRRNKTPENKKKVDETSAKVQSLLKSEADQAESTYNNAIKAAATKYGITNPASIRAIKDVLSNKGAAGNTGNRYKTFGGFEYYDVSGKGEWSSIKKDGQGKWRYYSEEDNPNANKAGLGSLVSGEMWTGGLAKIPQWGIDWNSDYQVAMDVAKFNNLIKKDGLEDIQRYGVQAEQLRNQAKSNRKTTARFTGEYTTQKTPKAPKIKKEIYDTILDAGDWEGTGNGLMVPISFEIDMPSLSAVASQIKNLQRRMQLTNSPEAAFQYNQSIARLQTYSERMTSGRYDANGIYNPFSEEKDAYGNIIRKKSLVEPVLTSQNKKKEKDDKMGFSEKSKATADAISQMGTGVEQLVTAFGGTVPEGFSKVMSILSALVGVAVGIQAIVSVIQILTAVQTAQHPLPFLANGGYIPKFAEGGRVGGSSFAGDHILARLNSGEVVLNSQQSGNILYQLSQSKSGGNNGGGASYVSGEKIFLGVNNYLKRTGKGEIVTTR